MGKFVRWLIAKTNPLVATNSVEHTGNIIRVSVINLTEGMTVITPDGLGEVKVIVKDWLDSAPSSVSVMLYRGYVKIYKPLSLEQYVVFHKPTGQFIRLSPSNYRYIYKFDQPITYRVTNRLYAQMTDESKAEYEYAKTLNKQRGGPQFLKTLDKYGLEIKKKK